MIALRLIRIDDMDIVRAWRNSEDVSQWMIGDHKVSEDEHRRWFTKMLTDQTCRYWIVEVDGVGVGVVSLNQIDTHHQRCSWTFYLAEPSVRGRGVGSVVEFLILEQAFTVMGLAKLSGEVLEFNAPVLGLHRKFGYLDEGRLVSHVVKGGKRFDVLLIAHFRERWFGMRNTMRAELVKKGLLA